jgi:glycosyltransferase involved in cell wall biosynthesis
MNETLISVIIPSGPNEKIENINRTILSLRENSLSKLEFIVIADGWSPVGIDKDAIVYCFEENMGERVTLNKGAEIASGSHMLRIDAHCSMSKGWDLELLKHCKCDTICVSRIDAMNETTWKRLGHDYRFVYINTSGEEKWWGSYEENGDLEAEPTFSFTGCGWLCNKDFYLKHLKSDVNLAKWGSIGPEMTLKCEVAGGTIMLCKKVVCGHVFTTNSSGYPISEVAKVRKKLLAKYSKYLYRLAKKFNAPGWEDITEDYILNYERNFMYRTDVSKKVEQEVKNADGKVIKKIIKEYKPVHYNGKENPDIPEIGKKIAKDAEIKRIKIAELNENNNWEFRVLETKNEIDMWLFENE